MVAVLGCEVPGFCGDLRAGFEIDEAHFAVEVEVALSGVQDVEDDDFVVAMAKVFEAVEQAVRVVEEVGDDDDEAAAHNAFCQFVKGGGEVGVGAFGAGVLKCGEEGVQMTGDRAGLQIRAYAVVKGD